MNASQMMILSSFTNISRGALISAMNVVTHELMRRRNDLALNQ